MDLIVGLIITLHFRFVVLYSLSSLNFLSNKLNCSFITVSTSNLVAYSGFVCQFRTSPDNVSRKLNRANSFQKIAFASLSILSTLISIRCRKDFISFKLSVVIPSPSDIFSLIAIASSVISSKSSSRSHFF